MSYNAHFLNKSTAHKAYKLTVILRNYRNYYLKRPRNQSHIRPKLRLRHRPGKTNRSPSAVTGRREIRNRRHFQSKTTAFSSLLGTVMKKKREAETPRE